MAALYGFTGMRIAEGDWRKYPVSLPAGWHRIEIDRIWIKGKAWHVVAEQGKPLTMTPAAAGAPQQSASLPDRRSKTGLSEEKHHAPGLY